MSLGKSNCGCSCWALVPFLLVLVFCCLLRCFLWRNASLAGGFAGRRVRGFLWFLFCLFRIACSDGHFLSLYKRISHSLCSCKDRAFSATSAKLEEKKSNFGTHSPKFSFTIAATGVSARKAPGGNPLQEFSQLSQQPVQMTMNTCRIRSNKQTAAGHLILPPKQPIRSC